MNTQSTVRYFKFFNGGIYKIAPNHNWREIVYIWAGDKAGWLGSWRSAKIIKEESEELSESETMLELI